MIILMACDFIRELDFSFEYLKERPRTTVRTVKPFTGCDGNKKYSPNYIRSLLKVFSSIII